MSSGYGVALLMKNVPSAGYLLPGKSTLVGNPARVLKVHRRKLGTGEGVVGLDGVAGSIRIDISDLPKSIDRLVCHDSERSAPSVRQEPVLQAMITARRRASPESS